MNIAYAVHYYDDREGTGGYVVSLATRVARDHEVTVYCVKARTPPAPGIRVVHVPALRGRAYATVLTYPAAFAAVRAKHDIVHAQGWVAERADVVTAHIVMAAWRAAARAAGVRPPAGEALFGRVVTARERGLVGRRARAVIAPSARAREDIARYYGRREGVTVIPHGFPTPTAKQGDARLRSAHCPPGAVVALYAGDARKGLRAAIDAVAMVPRVHLLVASLSPPQSYLAHAAMAGAASRVTWLPADTPMSAAYEAADLLLHPSIYDTFGLVVAEAMAHGVPVIVSRASGVSELIAHGRDGWICGDSAHDVRAALETLAHDRDLRARLGAAAVESARRRSWDDVARETMTVYEGIVRG